MANQADPATMRGASDMVRGRTRRLPRTTGEAPPTRSAGPTRRAALGPDPPFHGRSVSWVAVGIMTAGFLVGGLALIFGRHGPTWWLFWVGAGLTVLGLLTSVATNTFEDWY